MRSVGLLIHASIFILKSKKIVLIYTLKYLKYVFVIIIFFFIHFLGEVS